MTVGSNHVLMTPVESCDELEELKYVLLECVLSIYSE